MAVTKRLRDVPGAFTTLDIVQTLSDENSRQNLTLRLDVRVRKGQLERHRVSMVSDGGHHIIGIAYRVPRMKYVDWKVIENILHYSPPGGQLTYEIAEKIRTLYATGKYTTKQLAYRYQISPRAICNITQHRSWKTNTIGNKKIDYTTLSLLKTEATNDEYAQLWKLTRSGTAHRLAVLVHLGYLTKTVISNSNRGLLGVYSPAERSHDA